MDDGGELLVDYRIEPNGRVLRAQLRRGIDWAGLRRLRRSWKRTDDEIARWLMGLGAKIPKREARGLEHHCALAAALLTSATSETPGRFTAEAGSRRVSVAVARSELLAEVIRGNPWTSTDATDLLQVLLRVAKLPQAAPIYWETALRRLERADEDLASGFVRGFYQNLYYCWRISLERLALRGGPWARARHPTWQYVSSRQSADPRIEDALNQAETRAQVTGEHADFAIVLALLAEVALAIPKAELEHGSSYRGFLTELRRLPPAEISPAVRRLVRKGRLPRDVLWLEALFVRLYEAREHADYWHCFESRLLSSDRSEIRDATRLLLRITENGGRSRELIEIVPLHPPMREGPAYSMNGWIETPVFDRDGTCQSLAESLRARLATPNGRPPAIRLRRNEIDVRSRGNRAQIQIATDGFFELSLREVRDEQAAMALLRNVFTGVVIELQRMLPTAAIRWGELRGWSGGLDEQVFAEIGHQTASLLDALLSDDGFAPLYRDPEGLLHAWQREDGVTLILQTGECGPAPLRSVAANARRIKTLWVGLEHSAWQLAQDHGFDARIHHYVSLHQLAAFSHDAGTKAATAPLHRDLRAKLARLGATAGRAKGGH